MYFDERKLLPEAVDTLVKCPISTVHPYALMLGPVYVFMKLNQKFVSVKAPLDFFTPEELEKLSKYEEFYMPKIVRNSVRFQTAAKIVRSLLGAQDLTPYELSDEVLKVTAKLWGKEISIEPFFMAVFTHELCGEIFPEVMIQAREKTVALHDWGLLLSGAVVFLLVTNGFWSYEELIQIRNKVYSETVNGNKWTEASSEQEILIVTANRWMQNARAITLDKIETSNEEWTRKLATRLKRVKKQFSSKAEKAPSIYGEDGFIESGAA